MPLVYFSDEDWDLAHETLQVDSTSIVYDAAMRAKLAKMLGRIIIIEPDEVLDYGDFPPDETLQEEDSR